MIAKPLKGSALQTEDSGGLYRHVGKIFSKIPSTWVGAPLDNLIRAEPAQSGNPDSRVEGRIFRFFRRTGLSLEVVRAEFVFGGRPSRTHESSPWSRCVIEITFVGRRPPAAAPSI